MNTITLTLNKWSVYAPLVLRVGIAVVFIWFGWHGIFDSQMFERLVPAWTASLGSPLLLIKIHGIIEIVFGLLLLFGIYVRLAAAILFLSLLNTIFLVSGPTLIRDIGLEIATLSIILQGKVGRW